MKKKIWIEQLTKQSEKSNKAIMFHAINIQWTMHLLKNVSDNINHILCL